ncbi:MAG: tRNA-dihydrouridine synthase [Alphaproteobacteria bacterium]|nr:tRNA-dihydrouridine synthase [Alphaproteobacteria bacterium]
MNKKIKIYTAPMAGITDQPFRRMLRKFSSAPIFTEMIGVETLVHCHPKTLKMIQIQDEKEIVVQLVGANPASFAKAAKIVEDMGACGIDINMGCPVRKLIQNHSGAELMRHPDLAGCLVEAVKANTSLPVSVKTRLGWSDKDELLPFAKVIENAGADQLAVHARTKEMGFAGTADWASVAQVSENLKIPVIINGDIVDRESAKKALKDSQASAVMVGRALLGQPWQLASIESGKKIIFCLKDIVLEHFENILSYYGHVGVFIARKHLAWYARNKKNVAAWREKMYLEKDEGILRQMIVDFFDED